MAPSAARPRWIPAYRVDEFAEALLAEWLARSKSAVRINDREKALGYARARVLAELRKQGVEVMSDEAGIPARVQPDDAVLGRP